MNAGIKLQTIIQVLACLDQSRQAHLKSQDGGAIEAYLAVNRAYAALIAEVESLGLTIEVKK